jgi:hypothetical protein
LKSFVLLLVVFPLSIILNSFFACAWRIPNLSQDQKITEIEVADPAQAVALGVLGSPQFASMPKM